MSTESFSTSRYRIDIELNGQVGKVSLTDSYSGVKFSDGEYRYSAFVEYADKTIRLEGLSNPRISEEAWRKGGRVVNLSGRLGDHDTDPRIQVTHRLYIPDDGEFMEERLVLHNLGDKDIVIRGYRFGFRKKLERPKNYGGPGVDIEDYRLVALPFRLQPDGKKHDYQLDDLYHARYECSEFLNPARLVQEVVDKNRGRSEGWAWTDGEHGLLIVKYNSRNIEYSMLDTEQRADGTYLTFGGAAPSLYNEPTEARNLRVGEEVVFGKSRYHFYEGLWRRASYMFRDYMAGRGHTVPDGYDPRIHWNEIFEIGWHHNDGDALASRFNLNTIEAEAKRARDIGCEALYLDPGWEICEGSSTWDMDRLGDPKEFVDKIAKDCGLEVGLRVSGRSYCDDYPGTYRRRPDGSTGYYAPYDPKPFYEPCFASAQYQEEKAARIIRLANAGVKFFSLDEFDWRGACYDQNHGHPVPTTPNLHSRGVMEIVRRVREKCPDVSVEVHDPVWPWTVRYLPTYFLHNSETTYTEGWAFECKWNPLEDLLSGRALSLFYYNLAYELPLYTQLDMNADNDNCLAFWWYASTVRHIGIGGKNVNRQRFNSYRDALSIYKSLKELYTGGTFYGADELTHFHVMPESAKCVINTFNITDTPMAKRVEFRFNEYGITDELRPEGIEHEIKGGRLIMDLHIPPFSPMIIKLKR